MIPYIFPKHKHILKFHTLKQSYRSKLVTWPPTSNQSASFQQSIAMLKFVCYIGFWLHKLKLPFSLTGPVLGVSFTCPTVEKGIWTHELNWSNHTTSFAYKISSRLNVCICMSYSVTRLGDFWKIQVTNFHAKVALWHIWLFSNINYK